MDRKSSFANIFQAANQEVNSSAIGDVAEAPAANTGDELWIPINKVVPWESQPRQYFDERELKNLAAAFKEHGFKGAINVRPKDDDSFEIVAGERRWRAAQIAGLEKIRCFVDDFTDEQALDFALTENLNRSDLSKLEETIGIMQLIEIRCGFSQEEAETIIRTEGHPDRCDVTPSQNLQDIINILNAFGIELQTFRTRNLRSLSLPEDVKEAHLKGELSWSSALEVNKLKDDKARKQVLQEAIDGGLSAREVQAKVKVLKAESSSFRVSAKGVSSIHQRLKSSAIKLKTKEKELEATKKQRIEELLEQIEALIA